MARRTKSAMPKPGDVFITKLADGRFAAVRVLQTAGKSALVATTPYLRDNRPTIDEPLLRESLEQRRFSFRGQPARVWLQGTPSRTFELLGNIPVTTAEAECRTYGGKWSDSSGNEAFLEWRWIFDRPAFEEDVRLAQQRLAQRRQLPQKPKKMMGEPEFWWLLNWLDWSQEGDDVKVLAPAVKALAAKTKREVYQFEERLAYLLYQLDTEAHARNIGQDAYDPKAQFFSMDAFLYARCAVVANGREFYEAVLMDPAQMPEDMEFEALLGLAPAAYEMKTGEDFDYAPGCSYESCSNLAGWAKK